LFISDETFLEEFRQCFQNATNRLGVLHNIEEVRKKLAESSATVT